MNPMSDCTTNGADWGVAAQASYLLGKALVLAMRCHAGQTRTVPSDPASDSQGRVPYLVHPFRVAEFVRRLAGIGDPEVLAAALLHDVIEESGARFDEVEKACGRRVAQIVADLTNDSRLPQSERHEEMFRRLERASRDAKIIKLADRLDNLRTYAEKPDGNIQRYVDETRRMLEILRGVCPPLEQAVRETVEELASKQAAGEST